MEVIKTNIEGVVIIEPRLFKDDRGYFFESFSQREFDEKVRPIKFVQDNESMSSYGVMRGLHFQTMPYSQSKLVRHFGHASVSFFIFPQTEPSVFFQLFRKFLIHSVLLLPRLSSDVSFLRGSCR